MNIEEYYIVTLIASILVAAGLAFIPASIAKSKGYSFGLWWFYGWMIWIAAIIHVSCIRDKNAQQIPIYQNNTITSSIASSDYGKSAADELLKYKELLDNGVISEAEFNGKKEQLLRLI